MNLLCLAGQLDGIEQLCYPFYQTISAPGLYPAPSVPSDLVVS